MIPICFCLRERYIFQIFPSFLTSEKTAGFKISSTEFPCAVAISLHPQWITLSTARKSSSAKFVYRHHIRRHRTHQHLHSFRFRTGIENVCPHSKVILWNTLPASASSLRSSTTPTVTPGMPSLPLLSCRITSRRSVVLPHLGGEMINVCEIWFRL